MEAEQKQAIEALTEGDGYYILPRVFSPEQVSRARQSVLACAENEASKTSHFHGGHPDEARKQKRVWNLLSKGAIFSDLAAHPRFVEVFRYLLGRHFIMGSLAANCLYPGAPAQEPHIDYPYWDLHQPEEFPAHINGSFLMNTQTIVMLDDFTKENGATACNPGTQRQSVYPPSPAIFYENARQIEGKAGDVLIFNGLIWHASQANRSSRVRVGVLGQYLPKFVKPMENLVASLSPDFLANLSPMMAQLLGVNLRYPENLDEASPELREGRYARETESPEPIQRPIQG